MPNYAPQSTARKDADISAAKSNLNPPARCWRASAGLLAPHSVVWFCFTYACVDFPKASS